MNVGYQGENWLRAAPPPEIEGIHCSHREDRSTGVTVFRIEATRDVTGLATGDFATPSVAWPDFEAGGGAPEGTRAFGYQYTEFALPTHSAADLQRWYLLPFRPSVVMPMWLIAPDGRTLLLGPLDHFHEQVIGVPGARCGWHGNLDSVPVGFATELVVLQAEGPNAALAAYAELLRARHGNQRRNRYADTLLSKPSYWTDNGAAYWYRTEPGLDTADTLQAAVNDLRQRDIPFGSVQLDSWFYPHEQTRPFNVDEWVVPPTGLMRWEARDDVLPDGIPALHRRLGDPPLTTHCRHLSSTSSYVEEFDCWVDGERAHPKGSDLYERWLDQAVAWGVETFEHDWLVESFLGVRDLRAVPDRARHWQEGIDEAARRRGLTLQWCMATPADFLQTVTLSQITSIRTSGDHGYMVGPGVLWSWFLYTNALARVLGLNPFKDVFRSAEAHADVEALLSVMSAGPVGIGDAIGAATEP